MEKLIVFGSARADAFLDVPVDKADKVCSIDTHRCVIELSYGAKIPLKHVSFLVGGNGANVAVGTKRLGIDSLLVAELGEGAMSDFTKKELEKEQIDMRFVTQTKGVTQGFGAVIMYQGERTILSYYSDKEPPFPNELADASWAYLTSIGEKFEEYYEETYNYLTTKNIKLVFNPGGRQISKGVEWLKKYLGITYLLLVNREEAGEIVRMEESLGEEKKLLDKLTEFGVKVAVVTDGGNGAFAKQGENYFRIPAMPIDAIERTGAGDAFSTGCMSALILGKSLEEALMWGTMNSTSVIGFVGPEPGLLTQDGLAKWLERAKSSGIAVEKL